MDQLAEMRNALADKYGVVQVPSHSGKGDRVIELGLKAGIVKMTYTGNDAFRVDLLDSSDQPIGAPLVNRVGVSSSSAAFGLVTREPQPVKIRVHGDARWSIVVLPMSAAPEIRFPSAHDGSGVFLYGGDAATWTLMNSDAGPFTVDVFGQDGSVKGRLVHTTGRYFKSVTAYPGPVLITVQSSGVWTIDGH